MANLMGRAVAVWRESGKIEKANPRPRLNRQELEFLPAAIEVLDTPPSPTLRAFIGLICLLVVGVLAWGFFGRIDTVAVAEGRIIPGGRVKVVQPLEIGVVSEIFVKDGQAVSKGDPLIAFDTTETGADRSQVMQQMTDASLDAARIRATLKAVADGAPVGRVPKFEPPPGADPATVQVAQTRMERELAGYWAESQGLRDLRAQRVAARRGILAEKRKLEESLPLLRQREEALRELLSKGYAPRANWLAAKQALVEMENDLRRIAPRLTEVEAAIVEAEQSRARARAAFRAQNNEGLEEATRTLQAASHGLTKADDRIARRLLRAPNDGVVQQLQVSSPGAVVSPADAVLLIVPADGGLEIEAFVQNKDAGFVTVGQDVAIKVESFPFTRYGLLSGKVLRVSADAIQDEKRGLVYEARISLEQTTMPVGDRLVRLTPGLSVAAEVKTGDRRAISYFLSPLLRYADESLRER